MLSQSLKSTERERILRSGVGLIRSYAVVFIACFLLVLAARFDLSYRAWSGRKNSEYAKQINHPFFSHTLKHLK
jgi:hypothetical protein